MANYSRFYGEVVFYNKNIKNIVENQEKFKEFLSDYIEYNNSRYASFELCDDIFFDKDSEYVKTTCMFFNSEAKWSYQNNFQDVLIMDTAEISIMNDVSKKTYVLEDFIGFGIDVIGTDLEEGQQLFYDYHGVKEVIGVRDNHHLIIEFPINEVKAKAYNSQNINEFEANFVYGDLFTIYGIDIFFHHMMNDYREYDHEFNVILKKYAPTLLLLYEKNIMQRLRTKDIQDDLCSIFLNTIQEEFIKVDYSNEILIPLEDIEFQIDESSEHGLLLNYAFSIDWRIVFQNIEKNIKKYINKKDLDIDG